MIILALPLGSGLEKRSFFAFVAAEPATTSSSVATFASHTKSTWTPPTGSPDAALSLKGTHTRSSPGAQDTLSTLNSAAHTAVAKQLPAATKITRAAGTLPRLVTILPLLVKGEWQDRDPATPEHVHYFRRRRLRGKGRLPDPPAP